MDLGRRAGLPILPGLLRRDEVAAGVVDHAIRLTAQRTDRSYVWPARHQAGAANDPSLPPMGARFRLRASFDVSRFRPDTQVVLRAMQRYGMILADNGSNWYFTGTAEDGWSTAMLDELKTIPAGAFDAVDASSLTIDPNSGQVRGATPGAAPGSTSRPPPRASARPATTLPAAPAVSTSTSTPSAVTTTTAPSAATVLAAPPPPRAAPTDADNNDDPWWLAALGVAALVGAAVAVSWQLRRARPRRGG